MSTASTAGGFETDVTFVDGGAARAVAGFGCVFIDPDYPGIGPSSFTVFDVADAAFGSTGLVSGPNGSHVFRGLVAVDDATNAPVPAIFRVHVVSGNEWVGRDVDEDVALDDFVFGPTPAAPSTTTTTSTSTTSTSTTSTTAPPLGCVRAETLESVGCRLDALAIDVKGAPDLGRLKKSLAGLLDKARAKHAAARSLLTGPKPRKAKAALRVVQSRVKAFARLLRSRRAKQEIVDPTRRALLDRGEELVDDLRSVRRNLRT
jgi:hypothetical protein